MSDSACFKPRVIEPVVDNQPDGKTLFWADQWRIDPGDDFFQLPGAISGFRQYEKAGFDKFIEKMTNEWWRDVHRPDSKCGTAKGSKWEVVISSRRRSTRASGKHVAGDTSTSSTAYGSAKKVTERDKIMLARAPSHGKRKASTFSRGCRIPRHIDCASHAHDTTNTLTHARSVRA